MPDEVSIQLNNLEYQYVQFMARHKLPFWTEDPNKRLFYGFSKFTETLTEFFAAKQGNQPRSCPSVGPV